MALSLPIYEKLKPQRYEFYKSPEKIFIDAVPQGTGKTWTSHAWALNHNHNNISFFNTHAAIDELYHNISRFGGLNGQLNSFIPNINTLIGKSFILTPQQQRIYLYPECLCLNLYGNNYLFDLRNRGFLISNYCKDKCPDRHSCLYRQHKQEALRAYKVKDINNICMMPKSYIYNTEVVDGFTNNFKDLIVIFEESLFNTLYVEKEFNPNQITDYIKLINDIIGNDKDLREIWNPLEDVLLIIQNYIIGKRNLKAERKIKDIVKGIDDFNASIAKKGKKPLTALDTLNDEIKESLFNFRINIENTQNLTNRIKDILENIIKLRKLDTPVNNCFIINERDNKLSYIINKMDKITEIIRTSKKFIINDATGIEEMYKNMLPEFEDDIGFFSRDDLQAPWKRVYTLHKHWVQKTTYPKYSLMRKYKKKDKGYFKTPFYDLIDIVKRIFRHEYNEGREKVLILAFKAFIKELKEKLKSLIRQLRLKVSWEYWFNLEGKNVYSDCEFGIAFGSPGWSKQTIQVYNKMFGIPENILRWFSTEDQINQGMGRLRAILYPDMKIWYNLTNVIAGRFVNEVDLLPQLDHKSLFEYMEKMKWCDRKIIATFLNKSTISVGNLMKQLEKDGQITSRKVKLGETKHSLVYRYIGGT